ncbi:MAG: hypothetical protein J2P36_30375 [Ktedonobacteraceae bacterium]|nr:hypothetical protein [Ktedonobacteraceae bacterium]
MLIFTDEQRERAGMKSLSKRSHCRQPLLVYPLIVSDDAVFGGLSRCVCCGPGYRYPG